MTPTHLQIAIDGPSASGKGTAARLLAAELGCAHLDTGGLYRLLALLLLEAGISVTDVRLIAAVAQCLPYARLSDPALRREDVGALASQIAVLPEVRAALLAYQRGFAENPGQYVSPPQAHACGPNWAGAVLDGRDIGTVILPEASFKFFLEAALEVRVQRRFREIFPQNPSITYAEVLADLEARDQRDKTRAISPLAPAKDAVIIDTSFMAPESVVTAMMRVINR